MLPSPVLRLHSSVRQQHRHLSSSPRLTSLHKAGRELTSATSTPDTPVTGACRFGKALHSPVTADDEAGAAGLLISWWPISDIPATLERHLTSEPDRRMPSISANHHHLGIGSSEKMDMQALESSMRSVNLGVEIWQGNAVFASTSTSQRLQTPKTPPPPSQARGSAASPISIHSSPSSPTKSPEPIAPLPRPRAIPHYSSPLPRTAYTPPRSRTLPFPSDSPSRVQPTQTQVQAHANGSDRPVHPFFARTLTRSRSSPVPPSPHKPRYVAEYSSTSESQSSSQQTQAGESTFGSQEDPLAQTGRAEAGSTRLEGVMARMRVAWAASGETGEEGGGVEEGVRKGGDGGFEEITSMIGNVDLTGKFADRPVERKEGVKKPEQKQLENTGAQKTMADQVEKGESVRSNLPARPGGPNAYIAAAQARTDTPTASATAAPVKPTSKAKAAPTRTTGTTRPTKSSSSTSGKASYSTSSTSTSSAFAAASSRLPTPPPAIDPSTLPFFSYRKYDKPPNVAYTTDPDEANDLLSCLKGPVLGLDLEWPMAGMYDTVDPRTGKSTKIRVGMTWDAATGRYKFGQGKVALVQLCDERMIVLVHLMHMKSLPSKVVEIMTDPKVYKSGVQVRGDGMKLVRDFPESFPNGVTNLLEVNNVARRVDPISMGPGARLVSLANLTERYLQCRLDKETRVRKSNWHMVLSGQQREYAANDVYVSLQLHLELAKLGITNNIHLTEDDLSRCSFNINSHGQALSGIARSPSPTGAGDSNSDSGNLSAEEGAAILARSISDTAGSSGPSEYKPPTPAQIRAYESFRSGKSIEDIAADGGIRPATARGYVLSAVIGLRYGVRLLADQTGSNAPGAEEKEGAGISLSDEDKARLAKEMGSGGYMTAPQKVLMRALKAEVRLALGKDGRESGSDVSDVD